MISVPEITTGFSTIAVFVKLTGSVVRLARLILLFVFRRGRLAFDANEWRPTATRYFRPVPRTNLLRYVGDLINCSLPLFPGHVTLEIKDDITAILLHGFHQRIHVEVQPPKIRLIQLLKQWNSQ
jgi:hypothetical protein